MNQQKITSFFSINKQKSVVKVAKKVEEPFWEPLHYNRKRAFDIIKNINDIKSECEESYREKGVRCAKGKIDRVFNILEEPEAIRIMSLFERKIPFSRK